MFMCTANSGLVCMECTWAVAHLHTESMFIIVCKRLSDKNRALMIAWLRPLHAFFVI